MNNDKKINISWNSQLCKILKKDKELYEIEIITDYNGNKISKRNIINEKSLLFDNSEYNENKYKTLSFDKFYIKEKNDLLDIYNKGLGSLESNDNLKNPYILKDKEHKDSLFLASVTMNIYIYNILNVVETVDEYESLLKFLLKVNSFKNILNLWNIVFFRTGNKINKKDMENCINNFVDDYLNNQEIKYPINYLFDLLNYDGIVVL